MRTKWKLKNVPLIEQKLPNKRWTAQRPTTGCQTKDNLRLSATHNHKISKYSLY